MLDSARSRPGRRSQRRVMEVVKTIRCRPVADPVIDQFHRRYYDAEADTWKNTKWMGVGTQKCPLDLWIFQEILREIRPGLIIETGTFSGGSALYLAHICDLLGTGRIVSIDLDPQSDLPSHERITYLRGSSIDPQIVDAVPKDPKPVMVILDSDHSAPHVLSELRLYSPFVSIGSYLIVEDTNINGHPALDDFGPGPMEALEEFLAENDNFVVDTAREKFMLTFNPSGYLRRIDPLVDKADRAVPSSRRLALTKRSAFLNSSKRSVGCGPNSPLCATPRRSGGRQRSGMPTAG
jgi:cephalosporin hydroxylase